VIIIVKVIYHIGEPFCVGKRWHEGWFDGGGRLVYV